MKYSIKHDGDGYLRIRVPAGRITESECEVLRYAFSRLKGLQELKLYPATGGIGIRYRMPREELLGRLDRFQYDNVSMFGKQQESCITLEELKDRKLSPEVKNKIRTKILLEAAADSFLPAPLQLCYHAWQFIKLKE